MQIIQWANENPLLFSFTVIAVYFTFLVIVSAIMFHLRSPATIDMGPLIFITVPFMLSLIIYPIGGWQGAIIPPVVFFGMSIIKYLGKKAGF